MDQSESLDDLASVRRTYLRQESDIKSIGQLGYLVTVVSALGTLEFLLFALGVLRSDDGLYAVVGPSQLYALFWIFTIVLLVHTVGLAALSYGLTHLQSWARWTVVALTGLSLTSWIGLCLGFCLVKPVWSLVSLLIGSAVHILIGYPLLTPRVAVVFSQAYKEVVRATPEIRSRMNSLLKLFIALIVASLIGLAGWVTFVILV